MARRGLEGLLSPVRAAVQQYDMILPGERVAVGVSGGKDSMVLLALLAQLKRFYPAGGFSLTAITLDPCFGGEETDYSAITELCNSRGITHVVERTDLWDIVFNKRSEPNPCSLCARMRRGALHRVAQEADCGVVALGHHKQDAAETLLMNMFAGGSIDCFSPCSELTRRGLRLIRPMIYLDECDIAAAARREELPIVKSRCPVDGHTHRQEVKELMAELEVKYGPLPDKLVGAMQKAGISKW